jgi:hypothetical protein
MSTAVSPDVTTRPAARSARAADLAERLERGAAALTAYARHLTPDEWRTPLPHDGREIGVVVHHVASVYPVEIKLAQTLAAGKAVVDLSMEDIHKMNAAHAREHAGPDQKETLALLRRNSAAAADALRELSDAQLERAAPVSLYADAPLTCQFVLEDHAVRHSFHHLGRIRAALGR